MGGGIAYRLAAVDEAQSRARGDVAASAQAHQLLDHHDRALARGDQGAVGAVAHRYAFPFPVIDEHPVPRRTDGQVVHTVPERRADHAVGAERLAHESQALRQHALAVQVQAKALAGAAGGVKKQVMGPDRVHADHEEVFLAVVGSAAGIQRDAQSVGAADEGVFVHLLPALRTA